MDTELMTTAGKIIVALLSWCNKKADEKKEASEILKELKLCLSNIILHMRVCQEGGRIKHYKFSCYLPEDIEQLNTFLIFNELILGIELHQELSKFLEYLIAYNESLAPPNTFDVIRERRAKEEEIKKLAVALISEINRLMKELA